MIKNMTVLEAGERVLSDPSKLEVLGPIEDTIEVAEKIRKILLAEHDSSPINELDFHTGLETGLILGYYMFHPEVVTETAIQEQKVENKSC